MSIMNDVFRAAALAVSVAAGISTAHAVDISGAGATFPYPIYAKWADAYKTQTDLNLNYQSIGSGGGIKQIKAKTVTFGASDKPLEARELQESGLVQFPMIMGGVVPVINVKGIEPGKLAFDGPTLANEFTEATGDLYTSSLIALGLILFFITFIVLSLARLMLAQMQKSAGA